ncbi:hypothetical protein PoB_003912500 [Plakobranchus ocellatus]|uniref:Uncharacterized protein n=1 Tax=Plakobranchus ocellatus TaxID=259542 RepID=A0AAV4AZ94_9GAST|nr:hypothetical protein PoB_003912500 [Plakobranchus ocellatus]
MLPGLYFVNLWPAFIACHNHLSCALASTLQTYSQPSFLATTTIHALWYLLCQNIVSLHCLPQLPSMLPSIYSANLWSAFIACHNHNSYSIDSNLPTYCQPSLTAATTNRAPWPLLCQLMVSLQCLPQPPSARPGL